MQEITINAMQDIRYNLSPLAQGVIARYAGAPADWVNGQHGRLFMAKAMRLMRQRSRDDAKLARKLMRRMFAWPGIAIA